MTEKEAAAASSMADDLLRTFNSNVVKTVLEGGGCVDLKCTITGASAFMAAAVYNVTNKRPVEEQDKAMEYVTKLMHEIFERIKKDAVIDTLTIEI